jgi:adenylosuccinate lyase
MPAVAWHNAAQSLLERTLDDSANRRTILPEAFLILDEMLSVTNGLIRGLQVNLQQIERNFNQYAPFAATERVLMAAVKSGADRQKMHNILRDNAMKAWESVKIGQANPLNEILKTDENILAFITRDEIETLLSVEQYIGIAPSATRTLVTKIRSTIESLQNKSYTK